MFIVEQNEKIIFNMKYHSLRRKNNVIKIYDKDKECLGSLVEYKEASSAEFAMKEIKQALKHCQINKIYCIFNVPEESQIQQVLKKSNL